MDIHEKINELRKERGWSLSKLAKEAGIPETTVYNWYNESYMYSPIALSLIDQLGTDVELNEFIIDIFDLESNDDMTDIEGYISDISDLSFDIENSIIPVIKDIIGGYDFLNELKDNEMNIWNDFVVSAKEQEAEMGIEY